MATMPKSEGANSRTTTSREAQAMIWLPQLVTARQVKLCARDLSILCARMESERVTSSGAALGGLRTPSCFESNGESNSIPFTWLNDEKRQFSTDFRRSEHTKAASSE